MHVNPYKSFHAQNSDQIFFEKIKVSSIVPVLAFMYTCTIKMLDDNKLNSMRRLEETKAKYVTAIK